MNSKSGTKVFSLTSANGVSQIIQFFIILLLAREFGPIAFGQFALVLVLANFLAVLFDFGRSTYYTRELAFGRMVVQDFVRESAIRLSLFWLMAFVAALFGTLFGHDLLAVGSLLCASQASFLALQSLPKSQLKVLNLSTALVLDRLLCLCILLVITSQANLKLVDGLWAWIIGQVAGTMLLIGRYPKVSLKYSKAIAKQALDPKTSMHLGVFSTSNLLITLDQAILGLLSGVSQVGQYSAVAKWFSPISIFGGAVSTVISNDSALQQIQKQDVLKKNKHIGILLLLIGLTLVLLAILGRDIVTVLLGDEYISSVDIFPILAVGASIVLLNQPLAVLLQYFGHEKKVSRIIWSSGAAYLASLTIYLAIEPDNGAMKIAILQIAMQASIFILLLRMFISKKLNS